MRPQALAGRLSGDLDNIVLMALRKEPRRRYGSAAELSRDLEKHLQDLPVTARPDTLRYRTRKLLRRHRTAVATTAAMVLLVAGSVASLIAQRRQVSQERDKARYALTFLVNTFKQADPYHTQGENLTAREILDQGADRIARELAGQPDVQAAVMDAIGEVDLGLGRYNEAEPLLEQALVLRRRVFGPDSPEVADSLERLAALKSERSALAQAESLLRDALALRRTRQDKSIAVARTLNQLGMILLNEKGSPQVYSEAEKLHREALAIARQVEGLKGPTVAETVLSLADLHREHGDYAAAESLFQEGLAIEREALGDRNPRLYHDQATFGQALTEAGKYRPAEAVLRHCLQVQRELVGREHPDMEITLSNLAVAIHGQGRYAEAEELERELLSSARAHYGPTHWRIASILVNLANDLEMQGRGLEAVPCYTEALEIRRRTLGEEDPLVGQVLLLLAGNHRQGKSYSAALRLAQQALASVEKSEGPDHPHVAYALREIGRNYLEQRRFTAAEPFLRRSLDIRRRRLEAGHPDLAKAQLSLAECLIGLGRYDEAAVLLRTARTSLIAMYGPGNEIARFPDTLLAKIESLRAKPKIASGGARPLDAR